MDVRAYDKLMAMTAEKREKSFQTKKMIIHEERVKQKMERVNEVRELKRIGLSNREISRRTGLIEKQLADILMKTLIRSMLPMAKREMGS